MSPDRRRAHELADSLVSATAQARAAYIEALASRMRVSARILRRDLLALAHAARTAQGGVDR